jgi:YbgC/YbaW family acyl-CoA thioester hydrolase
MPEFSFQKRVSYADCTLGNHVYYSRYLEFMEEARGEFFRFIGFSCLSLQGGNVIFPVIECSLKYHRPARYDDVLSISVWLSALTKIRLRFECEILRDGERICRASTQHVCTDTAEKPLRIPEEVSAALREYLRAE